MWLSGLSISLWTKGSLVQFPVRIHAWVAIQAPSRRHARSNHTWMFLSLSFSLPSPISKNKYITFFLKREKLRFTSWSWEYCNKQDCNHSEMSFSYYPEPMNMFFLWLFQNFSLCLCFQQFEDDTHTYAFCMYPAWFYLSLVLWLGAITNFGNYQPLFLQIILVLCSSFYLLLGFQLCIF